MKRSKLDFYYESNRTTPIFTAYNSLWQNNPVVSLAKDTWDSPPIRVNISYDKPANDSGGSFADNYPQWGGKILTVQIRVKSPDSYVAHQAAQKIRDMTLSDDFIAIKRTIEFTHVGKREVEWLRKCYFTDVSEVDLEAKNTYVFAFVLTSQNRSATELVKTDI